MLALPSQVTPGALTTTTSTSTSTTTIAPIATLSALTFTPAPAFLGTDPATVITTVTTVVITVVFTVNVVRRIVQASHLCSRCRHPLRRNRFTIVSHCHTRHRRRYRRCITITTPTITAAALASAPAAASCGI